MSSRPQVRMLVEEWTEQRFIEGIFRDRIDSGDIRVERCRESSHMLGVAQLSLLQHPEQPIALIRITNTEDPIEIDEEMRGPIYRLLSRTGPYESWHVAFAIPRLDAWAMADPRIRQAFEDDEAQHGPRSYRERSLRFVELTRDVPFDRDALYRENAEFRGLVDFLERHVPTARPVGG